MSVRTHTHRSRSRDRIHKHLQPPSHRPMFPTSYRSVSAHRYPGHQIPEQPFSGVHQLPIHPIPFDKVPVHSSPHPFPAQSMPFYPAPPHPMQVHQVYYYPTYPVYLNDSRAYHGYGSPSAMSKPFGRGRRSRDSRSWRYKNKASADKKSYRSDRSRESRYRPYSRSESTRSSDKDDNVGHYEGKAGDSINDRYIVENELGTGTFGKVLYCKDTKHNDHVAVKVVRNVERYVESAKIEARILEDVYYKMKEFGSSSCMKMFSHFSFNGHYCLVCEPLGMSLYDYIKENKYMGFPMNFVREVARQLIEALEFLKKMQLVHTDLKLENIMFVSGKASETVSVECHSLGKKPANVHVPVSPKIKLIDFGGATYLSEIRRGTIINTRQYRSPEVILELDWSYPSDMWSAACIIAEHEELEHLAMIEKCLGRFPSRMLADVHPKIHSKYFHRDGTVRCEELSSESKRAVKDVKTILELLYNPKENNRELEKVLECMTSHEPYMSLH